MKIFIKTIIIYSISKVMKSNDSNIKNIGLIQISACVSETCTYPIDYIKTLLQINKSGKFSTYFVKSLKNSKLQFYTGLKPALMRHCIYTASRVSLYEYLRNNNTLDKTKNNYTYKFLIGGLSGGISQFIASPFDLLKIRYITNIKKNQNTSICGTVNSIVKKNGIFGLWKGATPNISRAILVNFGELATYDFAKKKIKKTTGLKEGSILHFFSSIFSGFAGAICCTPADVIKSRLMKTDSPYNGVYDCLKKTVHNEGVCALYKGFIPIWLRLAPWQIIFWTTYEHLRTLNNISNF